MSDGESPGAVTVWVSSWRAYGLGLNALLMEELAEGFA